LEERSIRLDLLALRHVETGKVLERTDRDDGIVRCTRLMVGPTLQPHLNGRQLARGDELVLRRAQRQADCLTDTVVRSQVMEHGAPATTDLKHPGGTIGI